MKVTPYKRTQSSLEHPCGLLWNRFTGSKSWFRQLILGYQFLFLHLEIVDWETHFYCGPRYKKKNPWCEISRPLNFPVSLNYPVTKQLAYNSCWYSWLCVSLVESRCWQSFVEMSVVFLSEGFQYGDLLIRRDYTMTRLFCSCVKNAGLGEWDFCVTNKEHSVSLTELSSQ